MAKASTNLMTRTALFVVLLATTAPSQPAGATIPPPDPNCDRGFAGALLACGTPATPVQGDLFTPTVGTDLWGFVGDRLQPALDGSGTPLTTPYCGISNSILSADCRDSTGFRTAVFTPYGAYPAFMGLDIENGYLFTAVSHGIEVWDLHSTPTTPVLLGKINKVAFPYWAVGEVDKYPMRGVDAPSGVDTVAALVGDDVGVAIIDTSNKSSPTVRYQNRGKSGEDVYTARIGGRDYAFAGITGGDAIGGLYVYDMTAASIFNKCVEDVPVSGEPVNCAGVYRGRLSSASTAAAVHGVDNYLVFSKGTSRGFEIYDATGISTACNGTACSLPLKLSGLTEAAPTGKPVYGVAMWKQGSTYYLGARVLNGSTYELRIYDVSCITSSCAALPAPVFSGAYQVPATPNMYVVFSRGGTTPYLYLGSDDKSSGGIQREWILDVSNPSSPVDLTPQHTIQAQAYYNGVIQTKTIGYWGWYYFANPTGFNGIAPRRAKFYNNTLYRAAWSLLDIHELANTVPVAPTIGSVTAAPDPALKCGAVTFTALNVAGSPTPTLSWEVRTSGGQLVATAGNATNFVWQTGPTTATGLYTGTATATSAAGSASKSDTVQINDPPALAFTGPNGAPTNDAFGGATVQFHVQTAGATEWAWDFNDGSAVIWTSDPVGGPNPLHTFAQPGTYNVVAMIRNCSQSAISSNPLPVVILDNPDPIAITKFQINGGPDFLCFSGVCSISSGLATFDEQFTGFPTYFDYDWNGDGTFEDYGRTALVTSRNFYIQGSFLPVARVRKGLEQVSVQHYYPASPRAINVTSGGSTAPNAPSGLSATAQSESTVALTWTQNSANENLFHLEVAVGAGTFSEVQVAPENSTTATIVGLSPATLYNFRVRASNDAGLSGYTNIAPATTLAGLPAAPTSLGATVLSSTSVRLQWTDNSSNETSFRAEARTLAGTFTEVATFGANATMGDVVDLLPDTTYEFRVRAANALGFSSYTLIVEATTLPPAPNAPTGASALAIGSDWIRISWADTSANELSFRLEQKIGTGPFSEILALPEDTTLVDLQGLTSGTPYTYRVRAANAGGFSGYSNETTATPPADSSVFRSGIESGDLGAEGWIPYFFIPPP